MSNLIERLKYWHFLLLFLLGVIVCWGLFFFLAPYGHGILPSSDGVPEAGIFETLYFSVVTISSLGYGDYRPIGYGRIVAIFEVVYGLVILALFVSKVASERTSTLIRLIYSSDLEKRIREFIEGNELKNKDLKYAINAHDIEKIDSMVESLKIAATAYLHFFVFQSREGSINERWAEKIFLHLLRSVKRSVVLIIKAGKFNNLPIKKKTEYLRAMVRILKISKALDRFYNDPNITGSANHVEKLISDYTHYVRKLHTGVTQPQATSEVNDDLFDRIKNDLPDADNWERDIHKKIAKKYRISNNQASRAIKKILGIQ